MRIFEIDPCPKPRMTRADRWKKRPVVEKYWFFKDLVRLLGIEVPESASHIHFIIPMPKSWSKKKKLEMKGKPHTQKPDKDNLEKGLLDAVYDEDEGVYDSRVSKWWGDKGMIIIEEIEEPAFPINENPA